MTAPNASDIIRRLRAQVISDLELDAAKMSPLDAVKVGTIVSCLHELDQMQARQATGELIDFAKFKYIVAALQELRPKKSEFVDESADARDRFIEMVTKLFEAERDKRHAESSLLRDVISNLYSTDEMAALQPILDVGDIATLRAIIAIRSGSEPPAFTADQLFARRHQPERPPIITEQPAPPETTQAPPQASSAPRSTTAAVIPMRREPRPEPPGGSGPPLHYLKRGQPQEAWRGFVDEAGNIRTKPF